MNSNFATKGYIDRKYDFRKRLISLTRLTKILKKYNFNVITKSGAPFFYTDNSFFKPVFKLLDFVSNIFLKVPLLSAIKYLANNVIILGKNEKFSK